MGPCGASLLYPTYTSTALSYQHRPPLPWAKEDDYIPYCLFSTHSPLPLNVLTAYSPILHQYTDRPHEPFPKSLPSEPVHHSPESSVLSLDLRLLPVALTWATIPTTFAGRNVVQKLPRVLRTGVNLLPSVALRDGQQDNGHNNNGSQATATKFLSQLDPRSRTLGPFPCGWGKRFRHIPSGDPADESRRTYRRQHGEPPVSLSRRYLPVRITCVYYFRVRVL